MRRLLQLVRVVWLLALLFASSRAAGEKPKAEAQAATESPNESAAPPSAPSESERARALFREGRKLVDQGKFEEACSKFEQSLKLDDGMGTRFNLANCYERIGRTASAYEAFVLVADEAQATGQDDREEVARKRAAALEPKLSRLKLDVQAPADQLEVTRGDKVIDKESWGVAVPVDPGAYELEARAPGRKPWAQSVEVPANGALVVLVVPELAKDEPEPVKAAPAPAAVEREQAEQEPVAELEPALETAQPDPMIEGRSNMRTASFIVGGVALAALVAGTTFALQYQTSNNDAKAVCRSSVNCTAEELALHESLVEDSKTSATLAYVGFGVGSVGLIGATLLFVAGAPKGPSGHERASNRELRPSASVAPDGSWAATLSGRF